jgi:arginine repressor
MRLLREGLVRRQEDLVRLLKKEGHEVTQSSISRDLRDLGVSKAGGRYVLPSDEGPVRTMISARWRSSSGG